MSNLAARQFAKLVERTRLEEICLADNLQSLFDVFGVLLNLVYHRLELVDRLITNTCTPFYIVY